MDTAIKADHVQRHEGSEGRILSYALLPLMVLAEGAHRVIAGVNHENGAPTRTWFAEARSQASIVTSYALMARSMLQSSERRPRAARLS